MLQKIKTIKLKMLGGLTSVNSYLLKTDRGFILIDTGTSSNRSTLEKELQNVGCNPGDLKLVIITHGDSDHAGNALYISDKYRVEIAMHKDDRGMVEQGDMFWNRKKTFFSGIVGAFMGLGKSNRFAPDLFIDDNFNLDDYGLDAKIISIPGHSSGSIGIITAEGDFFCGDLLTNTKKPDLNSIMDDSVAASESMGKLKNLKITKVYPGHGESFAWNSFLREYG